MSSQARPKFREISGDRKFTELQEADLAAAPSAEMVRELQHYAQQLGRAPQQVTVLDFGCGRGQFVGQLRRLGWRAFGTEVDARFVAAGQLLDTLFPDSRPLLALAGADGACAYPDGWFDVIVAEQVFEHVADLDGVAADLARLLQPDGLLISSFPASHTLVEPHYRLPLVHWLPKGRWQRRAIALLVQLGLGVAPPAGVDRATMGAIVAEYAEQDTFYRSMGEIRRIFARHGIAVDFRALPRCRLHDKVARQHGARALLWRLAAAALPLVALHNHLKNCTLVGRKRPAATLAAPPHHDVDHAQAVRGSDSMHA